MSTTWSPANARMPERIRAVLFDLDGTFADTAPDLAAALNFVLESQGQQPLPFDRIRPHVSHGARALIRLGFGLEPDDARFEPLRQTLLRYYADNLCRETRLFPGIERVIDRLDAAGIRWGIVTNKPARYTDPLMDQLGMAGRAACVISGDTLPFSKPHPQPILHGCELAGSAPAEAVYVGDAARDIEAGKRAGTLTLAALFGYIGDDDCPDDWGADGSVESPEGILEWIGEMP